MGGVMDPIAEEAFRQRLLLLAADNDAKPGSSDVHSATSAPSENIPGSEVACTGIEGSQPLEDMCKDLLAALNRERPGDPLSAAEVVAVDAAASKAVAAGTVVAEMADCTTTG